MRKGEEEEEDDRAGKGTRKSTGEIDGIAGEDNGKSRVKKSDENKSVDDR